MASKKQVSSGLAGSPIDFVSEAGTVLVPQDFTRGLKFPYIDF